MSKQICSDQELQKKIFNGVNKIADVVSETYGPRGRNVILHKRDVSPVITKDGVTVARFVDLDDPVENAGAQIIKQAAEQTNVLAGDGTTTATILARAILNQAQKFLTAGASPVELKRGIDKAVEKIVDNIKDMSIPVSSEEDIENIATISANGDVSIGKLIAMAVDQTGKDGAITVKEAKSMDTTLTVVEGFRFDSGYFAKSFVNDIRRGVVKYDDAAILVTDHKIEVVEEIYPILEFMARDGRPLIIVTEEVEGQALAALIMNAERGTMRIAAVKAPRYGEERRNILKDLCAASGAVFISMESGIKLKDVQLEHLGLCKSIEISKNQTTIVDGQGDYEKIEKRIQSLKLEVEQTDDLNECDRIQERITRLASGIAIINVGGATEIEMIEKKHRIEDALEAVKSAQVEGMVPGGGVALIRAAKKIKVEVDNEDQELGVRIIKKAVFEPLRQMAINASESPDLIIEKVNRASGNKGWDFSQGTMKDMLQVGVIDPAKVTRTALQNAASVASTLITTGHAVIEH